MALKQTAMALKKLTLWEQINLRALYMAGVHCEQSHLFRVLIKICDENEKNERLPLDDELSFSILELASVS